MSSKRDPRDEPGRLEGPTAYAMNGDVERILAAGCDGYLAKPIDTRALPDMVASYLHPTAQRECL
jgi:CheY-like chemotaxis protein